MSDDSSEDRSAAGPSGPGEDEERPEEAEAAGDGPDGAEGTEPEDGEGDEDERRPISVRDLMPEPSPERRRGDDRPPRTTPTEEGPSEPRETAGPEPAAPPEPEVPAGEEEEGDAGEADGGAPARPTPVRVAMDAPPPGDSRPTEALPSRSFEARGEEWIVRIAGRTITGTRPDAGALLMHLEFSRADEPEEAIRELLTVDRPLDVLYEQDLEEFLDRSRPARDDPLGEGS